MVVCAHGEVAAYCAKYEMEILEQYEGRLDEYCGSCPVVVTAQRMTREEYELLKCILFARGYDLVSVDWSDDATILALIRHTLRERGKHGGRQIFGYRKENGVIIEIPEMIAVARRVIALRDAGHTLTEIREEEGVRHANNKRLALSTIQTILKNRERYENG